MADSKTDVLVAVYEDIDSAARDVDALNDSVRAKTAQIEGDVAVVQRGDKLGRNGRGRGARAGPVVDPFAPPH